MEVDADSECIYIVSADRIKPEYWFDCIERVVLQATLGLKPILFKWFPQWDREFSYSKIILSDKRIFYSSR